jgi:hypothetical protein
VTRAPSFPTNAWWGADELTPDGREPKGRIDAPFLITQDHLRDRKPLPLPNEVLVIVGIVREFMRLERQLLNESPLARPSAALDLVKRGYMVKGPTGRLSLTPLGRMIQWRLAQLRAYQLGQEMQQAPADVEAFMSDDEENI